MVSENDAPDAPPEHPTSTGADDVGAPDSVLPQPTPWADSLDARAEQGGFVRGQMPPGRSISVNDNAILQTSSGAFYVGIGRDATGTLTLSSAPDSPVRIAIENREFIEGQVINTTRSAGQAPGQPTDGPMGDIDDLFEEPPRVVTRSVSTTPTLQERKYQEWTAKTKALENRSDMDGFLQNWISPIVGDWRETSPWGASRIKNGEVKIHAGHDMATPTGTQLVAPAEGIVTLASPDFYYEGGVVFIDHGLGFTSVYLHMSEVSVSEGDILEQGAPIGKIGATGSASGPHLCWRLYAGSRDQAINPMNLVR